MKKGYGAVLSFEVKGGKDKASEFINNLKMISNLANVGDAKTLIIHPASTTHQQLSDDAQIVAGITPGLLRLSIGIEHVSDILADLENAFNAIK